MRTLLLARAYIVRDRQVLVDKRKDGHRLFGGRVKGDESLRQALMRELQEELGSGRFTIGQVVSVAERLDRKKRRPRRIVEVVFLAHPDIANLELEPSKGHHPEWIDIAESGMRFGVHLE